MLAIASTGGSMDQQQISQLAQQIADQTAFHNIGYRLSLLAVALVSTVASFFGSYWKKRAETAATDADLKTIGGDYRAVPSSRSRVTIS